MSLSSTDALYQEGMNHYQARRWAEAADCFQRLRALDPERPGVTALLNEIATFQELERLGQAMAAGPAQPEPAPSLWRRWSTPLLVLAAALVLAGVVFLSASPWMVQGQRQADQVQLYYRAQAYLTVGDYRQAIPLLEEVLTLNPNHREAQAGLERARRLQAADDRYNRALQLSSEQRWREAAALFQEALTIEPDYKDSQQRLLQAERQVRLIDLFQQGTAAYDRGDWQQAAAAFAAMRDLDSRYQTTVVAEYLFSAQMRAGLALIAQPGDATAPFQEASNRFEEALRVFPSDRWAAEELTLARAYLAGRTAADRQEWEEAVAQFQKGYALRRDYAGGRLAGWLYTSLLRLAELTVKTGDRQRGLDLYRQAAGLAVPDPSQALNRVAELEALLAPPTPTPMPTVTPTVTPTPTRTPQPPAPTRERPEPRPTNTPGPPPTPTRLR